MSDVRTEYRVVTKDGWQAGPRWASHYHVEYERAATALDRVHPASAPHRVQSRLVRVGPWEDETNEEER